MLGLSQVTGVQVKSAEKSSPPHVIVVLGMHRSGTSALAGTFSQLGLNLGDELMPATVDANPKGYFEHVRIVQAHDRLLAAFGMDWADPRPLPESWMRHPATMQVRRELAALLSELVANGDTVVIKDPRLCRFVPLWQALFEELGIDAHFAFIARHPVEVAASLRRRDGMSEYRAGLLSLAYQLEAELATRGANRVFMTYEALITDWRAQLGRCRHAFGDRVLPGGEGHAAAVEGFLDAQLRNHRAADVSALDPVVVDAYRCFQAASDGELEALPAAMDALRERFEAGRRGYAGAMEAVLSALDQDHARHVPEWSRGLELASAWNAPPLDMAPVVAPKVYLRTAMEGYSEEQSAEGPARIAPDGTCLLAIDIPVARAPERLRFDPDARAGAYELLALSLDCRPVADLAGRVKVMHEYRLATADPGLVAWVAAGDDPWLELDIADGARYCRGDTMRIELHFRRLTASMLAERNLTARHGEQVARLDTLHDALLQVQTVQRGAMEQTHAHVNRMQAEQRILIEHARSTQEAQLAALAEQRILIEHARSTQEAQLAALAGQVHMLSDIVQELKQRSDRPVLYRLGRKWRARQQRREDGWKARLEPLANVSACEPQGWRGTRCDPQFLLRMGAGPENGCTPGWHVLTIVRQVYEGRLDNPCLYLDYGTGMQAAGRIDLLPYDAAGCSATVIYLGPGLQALRLDPGDDDARFDIQVRLQHVSRARAWMRIMHATARARGGGFLAAAGVVGTALRRALVAGPGAMFRQGLEDYRGLVPPVPSDYRRWLLRNEPALAADDIAARLAALPRRPLLSVVMPVYQAPERWLRRALDSVIGQHYPEWELCICDDASPSPHVRAVLEEYQRRDHRIKVVYRQENGHISASSNSALDVATGEYMVLLDHDDELHRDALLLVAEAVCRAPDAKLIYSDEDKIDEDGNRFDPYFKPDWNYDLFLGQNCISHLGVYWLPLVRELGGFRKGLEGSQDWDLALRCVERITPDQIVHIPRVLYHWRAIQGSTALAAGEKNYAVVAGRRAVEEHLQRTGQAGEVSILPASMMRVKRPVPVPAPKVSLVIPTRDRVDLLRLCVDSILERSTYPDYEILVVDNGSVEQETLDYFERISAMPDVRVLSYPGEFNYSAINNFAVAQARGEVIGLVNNDIEVISPGWMEEMVAHALRPDVGAVGAMLYYPDDTIQHAGVLVGLCGVAGHVGSRHPRGSEGYFGRLLLVQELSAVTAACLLVRRSVYEEVGGLDERLRVAFNDVDLCLRIREKGYRNVWTPFAELYHHESASRGLEDNPVKQARFMSEVAFMQERWSQALRHDPAYNPNLSLTQPFALES